MPQKMPGVCGQSPQVATRNPEFPKNKKQRVEETATYWGTAWATIALLHTLPPAMQEK